MSLKPYFDPILGETRAKDEGGGGSYVLPPASAETLGGVKIGNGIDAQTDGTISVTPYSLPIAGSDTLGGVKIGSGINVDTTGTMSLNLPVAAADVLGGIKVGSGLSIADGVLSASGGGISTAHSWIHYSSSGSFNAPATGIYLILICGGGGGGAAGNMIGDKYSSGGGGGGGGSVWALTRLTANQTVTFTLGAGGKGGQTTGNANFYGTDGGNSTLTLPGYQPITAFGGAGGGAGALSSDFKNAQKGYGGRVAGSWGNAYYAMAYSGTDGGNGMIVDITSTTYGGPGGCSIFGGRANTVNAFYGWGGAGGGTTLTGYSAGVNGGGGYLWYMYLS